MNILILTGSAFVIAALMTDCASAFAVIRRLRKFEHLATDAAGVSILRPDRRIENFNEETLQSTFTFDRPRYAKFNFAWQKPTIR